MTVELEELVYSGVTRLKTVQEGVIVVRFHISVVQCHGAGEFTKRLRRMALALQDRSEIVVRFGMARVMRNRLPVGMGAVPDLSQTA